MFKHLTTKKYHTNLLGKQRACPATIRHTRQHLHESVPCVFNAIRPG
jgi:hypothetical protein